MVAQWVRDAVIYHIFVDRFYPGSAASWNDVRDLRDLHGGTLWGVFEKLDYIAELGISCVLLSPIWPSPSHHGYDIVDHNQVAPRVGGNDALSAVVEGCHVRGIRVILDFVSNHVSNAHPMFESASEDPGSPYRSWFCFDDSKLGYAAFFHLRSMPKLNLSNPEVRTWLLDLGRLWLVKFDIDGYRLDHAVGAEPDFWREFVQACKGANPDCFCVGEVLEAPDIVRNYTEPFDGCLDIHLCHALRKTFGSGEWDRSMLDSFLRVHAGFIPEKFAMPTFLDNHDMDRFLYLANGNVSALLQAASVQMELPGPPIIYYGTEVGVSQLIGSRDGGGFHSNRTKMLWGEEQNVELLAKYKKLIKRRTSLRLQKVV